MTNKAITLLVICSLLFACRAQTDDSNKKQEPIYIHRYNILRNFIGMEPIPLDWIFQSRVWRNGMLLEVWQSPYLPLKYPRDGYEISKAEYVAKQLFFLNGRLIEEVDYYYSPDRYKAFVNRNNSCVGRTADPRVHEEFLNKQMRKSYFYFIPSYFNTIKRTYVYNSDQSRDFDGFITKEQCDSILYCWGVLSYGNISLVNNTIKQ